MSLRARTVRSLVTFLVVAAAGHADGARRTTEGQVPPEAGMPPASLPSLPVSQIDEGRRSSELDTLRTSLATFAEPLPIRTLVPFLLHSSSLTPDIEPDVEGTFVGELTDVTIRQALDAILLPQGLNYVLQDRVVKIFRPAEDTRVFDLDQWLATPLGGPVRLRASDGADPVAELSRGVESLLSEEGSFAIDREAAFLKVTDEPRRIADIGTYLEAVRAQRHRQVRLAADVVVVDLHDEFGEGVDWARLRVELGESVRVTQGPSLGPREGIVLAIVGGPDRVLQPLSAQGEVRRLPTATRVAVSSQPLMLRVAADRVEIKAVDPSASGPAGAAPSDAQYASLRITPRVSPQGLISLDLDPPGSTASRGAEAGLDRAVLEGASATRALVRVQNGEGALLVGLVEVARQEKPRPSLLARIGRVFRRGPRSGGRSDLVVLLSPTLLTPAEVVASRGVDDWNARSRGGAGGP